MRQSDRQCVIVTLLCFLKSLDSLISTVYTSYGRLVKTAIPSGLVFCYIASFFAVVFCVMDRVDPNDLTEKADCALNGLLGAVRNALLGRDLESDSKSIIEFLLRVSSKNV